MIRLIASDIDGTLVRESSHHINPEYFDVIRALKAKGMEIDPRDGYTPSTYWYWVLVHARYACWSRFPNSSVIAIDEVRKDEVERAMELLKSPYLDVDAVEWTLPDG